MQQKFCQNFLLRLNSMSCVTAYDLLYFKGGCIVSPEFERHFFTFACAEELIAL